MKSKKGHSLFFNTKFHLNTSAVTENLLILSKFITLFFNSESPLDKSMPCKFTVF